MPSLSAIQANDPIKNLYGRICERNPDIKKKGVVAGMRKLLILAYILWKTDEEYDKNYKWNEQASDNDEAKPSFGLLQSKKKRSKFMLRTR